MCKFEIGDWVQSVRVNGKAPFVGEIIDEIGEDYILRDAERRKWLRRRRELQPCNPER